MSSHAILSDITLGSFFRDLPITLSLAAYPLLTAILLHYSAVPEPTSGSYLSKRVNGWETQT